MTVDVGEPKQLREFCTLEKSGLATGALLFDNF